MLTIGSLCTGIGGLDRAVEHHFGADLRWYSDTDPEANEVMAVHRPHALAMGDFTKVDPATVEVPDILTAGFPCQPVSSAGKRKGTADDRWIFNDIITFIEGLRSRPTWMVLENVQNLLSHDQGRTAIGVVRQVAALGFDLRYGIVRASDAGMPHRRSRFFAVATYPSRPERQPPKHETLGEAGRPTSESGERLGPSGWGDFWSAIEKWEAVFGPAPYPADDNLINPRFVEWMMGHESGLVTDVISTRTDALRLLGNSVCPPQAALALELLDE